MPHFCQQHGSAGCSCAYGPTGPEGHLIFSLNAAPTLHSGGPAYYLDITTIFTGSGGVPGSGNPYSVAFVL